nr:uncharacterized protein LOC123570385 isoform X2 [Macaca fascicularis]
MGLLQGSPRTRLLAEEERSHQQRTHCVDGVRSKPRPSHPALPPNLPAPLQGLLCKRDSEGGGGQRFLVKLRPATTQPARFLSHSDATTPLCTRSSRRFRKQQAQGGNAQQVEAGAFLASSAPQKAKQDAFIPGCGLQRGRGRPLAPAPQVCSPWRKCPQSLAAEMAEEAGRAPVHPHPAQHPQSPGTRTQMQFWSRLEPQLGRRQWPHPEPLALGRQILNPTAGSLRTGAVCPAHTSATHLAV